MYIELVEKYQWSGGSMVSSDQALIPTQLLLGEDPSIWGNKSNASNITATVIMMMIVGAITLQPITICATKRNVQMMASQEMEQKYLFCSHTHRCHFFHSHMIISVETSNSYHQKITEKWKKKVWRKNTGIAKISSTSNAKSRHLSWLGKNRKYWSLNTSSRY